MAPTGTHTGTNIRTNTSTNAGTNANTSINIGTNTMQISVFGRSFAGSGYVSYKYFWGSFAGSESGSEIWVLI